jgi:hypothetical protein
MTTPDTYSTVPFDLYRDVHKAIRVALFDLVTEAGRLDPGDRPARIAHATKVRAMMQLLVMHAEHEDRSCDSAITQVLPERSAEIAADHVALEARMERLVELADLAFHANRTDDRAAVHALYLDLASFTSAYLAHQEMEEWDALGIEPLLAIHGEILASLSPEEMGTSLALMLPAMNIEDRVEMLAGMCADAPPEAFAPVWALAGQVLTAIDFDALSARLATEALAA